MAESSDNNKPGLLTALQAVTEGDISKEEFVSLFKRGPEAPQDYRFSTTNQYAHCWERYHDWMDCMNKTDNNHARCFDRYALARNICPNHKLVQWKEQMMEGTFPGEGLNNPDF